MYDTWNIFRDVHNFNGYPLVWITEYRVFKIPSLMFIICCLFGEGKRYSICWVGATAS